MKSFSKPFTKQSPLPEAAKLAAERVLSSADLHRYQDTDEGLGEVAALEREFADWQGAKYCLAVASGGQAMQLALRSAGVETGEPVLTNSFTLAPVPGAIRAVGANPCFVEITEDLVIDLEDLARKAQNSGARILLLSHMRGHLAEMEELSRVAKALSLTVIEDCAHTMGAKWNDERSGSFGKLACFSTQTYKHINSGEGGFLTSDDPQMMARAVVMSGSYMNYSRHGAAPDEAFFKDAKLDCPNMSARMDMLRAAILRPQLGELDRSVTQWNERHDAIVEVLRTDNAISLPGAPKQAMRVGSSIQFRIPDFDEHQCMAYLDSAAERGVELKWFGRATPAGFTSSHRHWRYVEAQELPETDRILSTLFDMRIPLSFSLEDCRLVASILCDALRDTMDKTSP